MLTRKQVIMLASITMISLLIASSMAKDRGGPFDEMWKIIFELQSGVDSLKASLDELQERSFIKSPKFIITNDNGTIKAVDGENGVVSMSASDLVAVWNWVRDNGLTSGRDWKEKVLMKGNFTITDSIKVPSYTILEIFGSLTPKDYLDKSVIENEDTIDGNSHIEVIGGCFYGNVDNQASNAEMYAIGFWGVSNSTVRDIEVHGWKGQGAGENPAGIHFGKTSNDVRSKYNKVVFNRLWDCRYAAIFLSQAFYTEVSLNHIFSSHRGIYLSNARYCIVTNNHIMGKDINTGNDLGIRLYASSLYNEITNNHISDFTGAGQRGITITHPQGQYNIIKDNILVNCDNPIHDSGSNNIINFNILNDIAYPLEKGVNYIVGKISGYTYMLNGQTGRLEWKSTNASAVINAAIGNLTSGRTWKEKVILKGNFSVTATIRIPSYTILDLHNAKLTATNSLNEDMIKNNDTSNGDSHIEILGGILDLNGDNQDSTCDGIEWTRVEYSRIFDVTLLNSFKGVGDSACLSIWSQNYRNEIASCRIEDAKYGFRLENSHHNLVHHNFIYKCGTGLFVKNAKHNVISENTIRGYNNGGSHEGLRISVTWAHDLENLVMGNDIYEWLGGSSCGLTINPDAQKNYIINNKFYDNANNVGNIGTSTTFEENFGFVTENNGITTVAHNEYVAHGLDPALNIAQNNSTVLVTPYTTVYNGEPVVVACNAVNSTHIRMSAYWTNGTAITIDAIDVWWSIKYTP